MRPALVAAAAAVALLAGCVAPPSGNRIPPEDARRLDDVTSAEAHPTPTPHADDDAAAAGERRARAAALRLRITGPEMYGAGAGSGFAIDEHTVITNAHVVAGGEEIAMTSWDGHDVDATGAGMSVRHDLALLDTRERVPVEPLELADADPARGAEVVVVGYPDGGRITVQADATVIDVVDGGEYDEMLSDVVVPDRVVRLDAESVRPGSSGGPVLNADGEVVGVIFGLDLQRTGEALAVSVSVLRRWLAEQ